GKGSTAAFCRAIAEAAGLKAHIFSSPHLIRVNERIRIAGHLVSDEALSRALEEIAKAGPDLTYFEALTAAAYLLFSRTPADVSIIETGAGGLLDSTNVMRRPAATAISAVSRDHEALFGTRDIAEIARTKAGIFRTGVPAFIAEQDETPFDALIKAAGSAGAVLKADGMGWRSFWDEDDRFAFVSDVHDIRVDALGLPGPHQASNAGLACAAMESLALPDVNAEAMAKGLSRAKWPARLQTLADGPLTRLANAEIIVDGAHNPAAATALAASIARSRPDARTALIIAMQANKDASGIAAPLAGVVDDVFACPLPEADQEGGRAADPHQVAGAFAARDAHAMAAANLVDAVKLANAAGAERIYICGSLYLAGAVLGANGESID
ncbi:MAG: bifunctional folylpolyglutamate synthase/dihydrofolate synthase, partial [Pseudomonadota bacterium]